MPFDHEKLDVYHRALDAVVVCDRITAQLPAGRAKVRDQVDRAATSVLANIAEGAGEFSSAEKARFYRMARRSAMEVVAWLDICRRRDESDQRLVGTALERYEVIVSMLVRLIKVVSAGGRGRR